jgi:uncharacterized heparinase superfamily protein
VIRGAERLVVAARTRYAAFCHLGIRQGSRAALRQLLKSYRAPARRLQLRLRPVQITPSELSTALGEPAVSALRGRVRDAMPTVARWEAALEQVTGADRAQLLARADRLVAHEFDLLGSGPVRLGRQIDWHRDFKSGRRWPAVHHSRIRVSYPDDSDIKVPWELSRFQHLPLLAAAFRVSGERSYLDELGAQLESWIDANPVEIGVNWASTMDVAIRAANWTAALVLCADDAAPEPWFERALRSLLAHGRFIRGHLEHGVARGNHYLADVVGLQAVAALFATGAEGRAWAGWTSRELIAEMEHQVREDGCAHEASLPYHRLVCELFVCATQAADVLTPGALPPAFRERLERMLTFAADTTRGDGLSPQMGDADNGRYLPLADYGVVDQRDHAHLFAQAARRRSGGSRSTAYPHGGWWVIRAGALFAVVRCGDVGIHGRGCHAHNDQLSFELAIGAQPLIVDAGSYLYTADPGARNLFRATRAHATLAIGGGEQNHIRTERLFAMEDAAHARCLRWEPGERRVVWEGEHTGFPMVAPDIRHRRRVELDGATGSVVVADAVRAPAGSALEWSFPLAVGARSTIDHAGATVRIGAVELRIEGDDLDWRSDRAWVSPSYGVREPASVIRATTTASAAAEDVRSIRLQAATPSLAPVARQGSG